VLAAAGRTAGRRTSAACDQPLLPPGQIGQLRDTVGEPDRLHRVGRAGRRSKDPQQRHRALGHLRGGRTQVRHGNRAGSGGDRYAQPGRATARRAARPRRRRLGACTGLERSVCWPAGRRTRPGPRVPSQARAAGRSPARRPAPPAAGRSARPATAWRRPPRWWSAGPVSATRSASSPSGTHSPPAPSRSIHPPPVPWLPVRTRAAAGGHPARPRVHPARPCPARPCSARLGAPAPAGRGRRPRRAPDRRRRPPRAAAAPRA